MMPTTNVMAGDEAKCKESLQTSSRVQLLSDICCDDGATILAEVKPHTECHPDDTCTLLFSSGTTGLSKAVELSHRNFMSAIAAYNALEPGASTSDTDVCLAIIPMYHVYGLGIVMLATLERGASVVTMERYSLPAMLKYVEDYKITVATLVPPILVSLVKSADVVAKYDLSSLKIIATGTGYTYVHISFYLFSF
jgi:acyl-CoA synthetase (AMP-forming)/AMP-acid ligase II